MTTTINNDTIWQRSDARGKLEMATGLPPGVLDTGVPSMAWLHYIVAAMREIPGLSRDSLDAVDQCEQCHVLAPAQNQFVRARPVVAALAAYREAAGLPLLSASEGQAVLIQVVPAERHLPMTQPTAEWHPTAAVARVVGLMARTMPTGHHAQVGLALAATDVLAHHVEMGTLTALLRCVVGNPFAPAIRLQRGWIDEYAAEAVDAVVAQLNHLVNDGHADQLAYLILADALEEAGCAEARLLGHLRSPGPHARGCWAVRSVAGIW